MALLLAAALSLSACGLQPMYAGGGSGPVAQGLAAVEVGPIEGRAGWLVRNALNDRLTLNLGFRFERQRAYYLDAELDPDFKEFFPTVTWRRVSSDSR